MDGRCLKRKGDGLYLSQGYDDMGMRYSSPMVKRAASILIFAGLISLVEYWIGWGELLKPWRDQSFVVVTAAALLTMLTYWFRAIRLYDYFKADLKGRLGECLKIMLIHNMLNNLLPMRTGEISFPVLMQRHFGMRPMRSTSALLWFRILDLHTLILFGLLAIGLHSLGIPVTILLTALWLSLPPALHAAGALMRRRIRPQSGSRLERLLIEVRDGLPLEWRDFIRAWMWTLVNWLVKLGIFAWVLMLFIAASPEASILAAIGGDLTSVLPIHGIAGAGTYEGGVVAALLPFGYDAGDALAAAINLHLFVLASAILGGFAGFLLPDRNQPFTESEQG